MLQEKLKYRRLDARREATVYTYTRRDEGRDTEEEMADDTRFERRWTTPEG